MYQLLGDLRFALGMFARNPGTTAVAALSLALAIGPNSALFSVVDRLLLKPPSVEGIGQVYSVYFRTDKPGVYEYVSYPDLPEYRAQASDAADLIAFDRRGTKFSDGGEQQILPITIVSENFFSVLKVRAAAGRMLAERDAQLEGPPPAVISYSLWQRRFGGRADAVGKTVLLNERPYYIAGVAPRGFGGPPFEMIPPDLWVGFQAAFAAEKGYREALTGRRYSVTVMARLHDGVPKERVEAALTTAVLRLGREHPEAIKGRVAGLSPAMKAGMQVLGWLILSVVGLVLLIACANVAGVFLAQGETRQREFAVRLAMGAARGRLVRQLMAESLMLSVAAAGLGLVLAKWLIAVLPAVQPKMLIAVNLDLGLDFRVVAYTVVLAIAASLAAGLLPALRVSRPDLAPVLKGESAAGGRRFRFRWALIVAQIAVAQFLLAGAGLLVRSYVEVRRIRPGFDPDRKLLLATLLPNRENANISFADLADSLRAVPGVRRVSFIRQPPMGLGGEGTKPVFVAGATQEPLEVAANSAGADYFAIMGTRLLRGRDFSERDVRGTVIVNEVLARRLWGSADAAVGRFLRVGAQDCQVAGVVENGKYHSLVEDPIPYLYTFSRGEGTLVIETAGEPGAMAESVRKAFRESAPDASLVGLVTLREHLRIALFAWQITAGLLGISAVLGVFLAGVGLYGLVSYGVNRRAHEIGVRMAMGASPADVLRLVLRQALAMAGIGAAIGLACAFAAAKVVSALLYRVSPADPLGLLAGIVVVAAVTLLAAQAPARRAIRLDPMAVLRRE